MPYVLRHTALTKFATKTDEYTLSRIAGHSSITMTQRYVHPQAEGIERAFDKMNGNQRLVTEGGHQQNQALEVSSEGSVN